MPAVAFKTGDDVDAAHELRFHAEDECPNNVIKQIMDTSKEKS